MPEVHMMIGNVGSGKSEMSEHLVKKLSGVVVNMDAIQESMHTFYGGYRNELKPVYQSVEESIIKGALEKNVPVIIDRTNMDKKRRARFIDIANQYSAEITAYQFPELPTETLLERRMRNPRGITRKQWQEVLFRMSSSFEPPTLDEGFKTIIPIGSERHGFLAVDFDGTICNNEFPDIGDPIESTLEFMRKFWAQSLFNRIIVWTCRGGDYVSEMAEFLRKNNVPYDYINENPLVNFGSPKVYANRYLDDRNILLGNTIDIS